MKNLKSGVAIATAAAALFSMGLAQTASAQTADKGVKCTGTNSCKGSSECKTASSSCKGKNSCKGQGWVTVKSDKDCTDKGGKVVK
ncbi:hypothetical protein HLB44_21210 [Aquincola sp. S2]|uniref:DUF2282 domain-containing protein n=1 Tax=Pseudaquabacterium terrae TaxID=2732868 RepID=A0ABX2ELN8_9BURK|nr:hypothetical protein [Aquabacterium terrae]NRF69526.1 hypothetical protein [Aquabacterium terrae]